MNLQHRSLKLTNAKGLLENNLQAIQSALQQMEKGVTVIIDIRVEDTMIAKLRAVYFAMVTELGRFAGYQSAAERAEFKEQVKNELKVESIASITDNDEMKIIIESLHQLAATHYDYIFKPNDPDIFTFNTGQP